MRPYLAIIKDSFRAAMASRVLYVLILLITILLLALAPLHMRETLDWELNRQTNVKKPERLLRQIVEKHDQEGQQPIARIWELLPQKTRKKMIEIVERPEDTGLGDPDVPGSTPKVIEDIHTYDELIVQLNGIIENPNFYRPEDWEGRNLPSEADDLIENGVSGLSEIRKKRLNRLLVSSAVAPSIDTGNETALDFHYAIWRIPITVGITHQQFAQTLTAELPWYFEKLVLSVGLLIAIIVTANMIPETFESGSLNLLLSKPISRWGMYTSKFFGGCVFIALCAAYLFIGIWLWMGIAMGVWDRAILFSIPLYVIVFAIYFSVSAVVGLVWRSPIVAVILTLLFWAFCFSIGSVYSVFNTKMKNSEFINLLPVEEKVYPSDLLHQVSSWDSSDNQWSNQLEAELGEQGAIAFGINSFLVPLREVPAFPGLDNFLAPVYDSENSRIIASRYEFGQSMSSGKKKLFVSDVEEIDFKEVGHFPRDAVELFQNEKGIVAVTSDGSFYLMNESKFETATQGLEADKQEMPEFDAADKFYVTNGRLKTSGELMSSVEKIITETSNSETAFGNTDEAIKIAKEFVQRMAQLDDKVFVKDGGITNLDPMEYRAYCLLSEGKCALMVRIPKYRKFTDDAKDSLELLVWSVATEASSKYLEPDVKLGIGLRGIIKWGASMTGDVGSETPKAKYKDKIDALAEFFVPSPNAMEIGKKIKEIEDERKADIASKGGLFDKIGPDRPTSIRSANHVDYSYVRDEFASYQRGKLIVFRADGDRYNQHATLKINLGFDKNMTCRLAYQGDTVLLAFGNGKVITVDAEKMVEKNEYQPESRSAIEEVGGSPDGQHFAVLYRNGNLWMLDSNNDQEMHKADVTGQGQVCAFAFGPENLWVSDNTDRATRYPTSGGSVEQRLAPSGNWIQKMFRFGLRPFYKACPKPGEFYKVVTHLSSSGDTEANADVDLNETIQSSDPWAPLWSGLAFMFTMLAIGCLIFQFKDY